MIRRISLLCNTQRISEPDDLLFTYPGDELPDLSLVNCPACRARGMYQPHGSYKRYVVDVYRGKIYELQVAVPRVRCTCGHTHALLKDTLIPYSQYTLRFILTVLKAYFRHSRTVAQICRDFCIAAPTLYRWKRVFLAHRELWLGLLRSRDSDPSYFLRFIDHQPHLSSFLHAFFLREATSFLQLHRNPAYS